MLIIVLKTSAHPAPKHMCMHARTRALQNVMSPLCTPFPGFPPQTALPQPPVGSNASCLDIELFPRSQTCGWFHFREAWWEAALCCGLTDAGGLCLSRTSLPLLASSKNRLRLHTLVKEGLSGHTVPSRLAELSGGRPPLAWAPGPAARMCSLRSMQCVTLYRSFCLLGLCLSHLLNGYHDTNTHLKGLLGLDRLPMWGLFVNCIRWSHAGEEERRWWSDWEIAESAPHPPGDVCLSSHPSEGLPRG